jgi:hypothetical protein
MNRRLALIVAAATMLFAAAPVRAQQPAAYNDEGIGFGLEVGLTRDTITASDAENLIDSRTGLLAGIWFGGNRNGTLGFMGEISYVVKGAKESVGDGELKLTYVEIPALIRINLGQTSNKWGLIVYPLFGPVVDINLKATDGDGNDVKDFFNGYDIGIIGGVGVEVARIGVEVRMNWGLKTLEKGEEEGTFTGLTDTKNKSLQILAKIRLN